MLFAPDTPQSHRLAFVVAATVTFSTTHAGLSLAALASAAPFWFIVLYNWIQRRKWRAQGMTVAEIRAQLNPLARALERLNDMLLGHS